MPLPNLNRDFILGMFAGGFILSAGILLGGAGDQPVTTKSTAAAPEVLQARRFEVVDELGTVLLSAGSTKDGGSLSLRDRFGKPLVVAAAAEHGGTLVLSHATGAKPAFAAGASTIVAGESVATLSNGEGKAIFDFNAGADNAIMKINNVAGRSDFIIQSDKEDGGSVMMAGGSGTTAVRLYSNTAGSGVIETYRKTGAPLVSITSTEGGHGQISTLAGLGKPLVTLTATANHDGQLYTYNEDGEPLIALASRPGATGGATLRVFNKHGEAIATMESNEAGEGVVGAWKRDGSGRSLTP